MVHFMYRILWYSKDEIIHLYNLDFSFHFLPGLVDLPFARLKQQTHFFSSALIPPLNLKRRVCFDDEVANIFFNYELATYVKSRLSNVQLDEILIFIFILYLLYLITYSARYI